MNRDKETAKRFQRAITKHEMTVLHDVGLYRHVRFKAPGTSSYWFDLVTWPGNLAINGDMGSFTFARIEDMFEFFRGKQINPQYWAEKVRAGRGDVEDYSEELFKQQVADDLKDAERDFPGVTKAWKEKVDGVFAEFYTSTEGDAQNALNHFEYLPDGEDGEPFRFRDSWEWRLQDYTWQYLWCCYAIQWGVGQYESKPATIPAPVATMPAPDPYADVIVLNFSMRVLNCLRRGGIHDVRTLLARSEDDLMDIKGFGSGALYEVTDVLAAHGLELAS